jgi:hypothetical protein
VTQNAWTSEGGGTGRFAALGAIAWIQCAPNIE